MDIVCNILDHADYVFELKNKKPDVWMFVCGMRMFQ